MPEKITRRRFHQAGTTLAFGLAALQTQTSGARILGANDRIRTAFIGTANRGRQLIGAFSKSPDMELAALCDVDSAVLEQAWENAGQKPIKEHDFRDILARDDIDAVVLATPDHWHAWQTVAACRAGKDVYVEKPLSTTVKEGRAMVEAARKYDRVVQVGTHRRSGAIYQKMAELGVDQKVGKTTVARCWHKGNMFPNGIGRAKPTAPPENLDWDLWLGPQSRDYQENIAPYKFRWWNQFSSQIANNGVHFIDLIRWYWNETAPASVCAMGGVFAVDDDRTIPDTMSVCYQFASGRLLLFDQFEANGNPMMATDEKYQELGYFEMRGTQGTCYFYDHRCLIKPEKPGQFQEKGPRAPEEEIRSGDLPNGNLDITAQHAQNFFDCIRSRQKPNADVEQGHRSTTMSLIANISLAVERRLEWDAQKEEFIGDEEANRYLSYEYREPWKLEV
ncbi:MAG: Gfo/Idh/MocA family oxidoreductase [Thermoguttaceae bacterium]|nr:Gfo/Idh/MocA family oxidoreductase [Thermoguttaceae bacterium]